MSSSKLIVVLGATGKQGGSVVDTFLQESEWRVRGITRNTSSANAQALQERGVEVVQAELNDTDTLRAAFKDANAIFAVTNFWDAYLRPIESAPGKPRNQWAGDLETQQLKNVIDAAAEVSTLDRLVLSSLSNATKWSKGKYTHVYHFDSKAKAEEYGKEKYPELWSKTSIFQAGLFLNNFVSDPAGKPTKDADGVVNFISSIDPDVKVPFIVPDEDSGPFTKALIENSAGKNLIAYREWLTTNEAVKAFTEATGLQARITRLPRGEFHLPLPEELKLELSDMLEYINEFGYEGRDDPTIIHPSDLSSPPKLRDVRDYFQKQDWEKILS